MEKVAKVKTSNKYSGKRYITFYCQRCKTCRKLSNTVHSTSEKAEENKDNVAGYRCDLFDKELKALEGNQLDFYDHVIEENVKLKCGKKFNAVFAFWLIS